jgi:hypothetical protein
MVPLRPRTFAHLFSISLGSVDGKTYEKILDVKLADVDSKPIVEDGTNILEVFYLEGFPTWDGKRKGDIEF